jgi:two-component system OmpR family sensor kinase
MASLRARLIAALLAACACGMLLVGAITYLEQRSFQYDRVDDQARAAIGPAERALRGVIGPGDGPGPRGIGAPGPRGGPDGGVPPGTYAELRDAQGNVVDSTVLDPLDQGLTADPDLPDDLPPGEPVTVEGDARYRALAESSPGGGTTIVAVPLAEADETLSRLLLVEALVTGAVLALLAAVAWAIVRVGLRPLDRMAGTAARIAGGELDRRVEDTDERTETGRLGRALNAMLDRLEHAFRERESSERRLRTFLADAAHELRTPLVSMRGYAELFRMGAAREPADVEKAMRRIEEESTRMGALLDDMLTLARLDEVADVVHADVDLAALARDAVEDARARAPGRPISTDADGPVVVRGDADRLRQVLGNLVGNALVHTPPGTAVEVGVSRDGAEALLEVRDHGPGLPPDADPEALFERFWRAGGGRERGPGGAGLGLAIVAAIAAAHGGRVTAADAPGGGASFVVALPAARTPS